MIRERDQIFTLIGGFFQVVRPSVKSFDTKLRRIITITFKRIVCLGINKEGVNEFWSNDSSHLPLWLVARIDDTAHVLRGQCMNVIPNRS